MNVRELLRYELWSKRTTRRILAVLAVILVVTALGFVAWYEIDLHWMTSGERAAAKAALHQIDVLQDAGSLSDEEFKTRRDEGDSAVNAAESAIRTTKDEKTYLALLMCSVGAGSARDGAVEQRLVEQGKLHESKDAWERHQESDLRMEILAHRYCSELHKILH